MAEDTDIVQASIVMVGNFNPAIFSPAWFAKNGVITDLELAVAETQVIHPRVTRFSVEHMTVSVEPVKFSIELTTEPIIRLVDLVLQTFRDLLPHIPITAIGINYGEHWRLDSWRRRVALGRALAPLEPWGEWAQSFQSDDPQTVGGVIELTLLEPYRAPILGHRRVAVGPSSEVADKTTGVYVSVNHHRDIPLEPGEGAAAATEVIEREFDDAVRFARRIIGDLRAFTQKLEIR